VAFFKTMQRRWISSSLDASRLAITLTKSPRAKVPNHSLVFGRTFTDHMLEADWDAQKGWGGPLISPYHTLQLDPAASALHYALQAFEGMKAYIDQQGKIRMFRPEMNMERLKDSAERLCFPVSGNNFLDFFFKWCERILMEMSI
jgi:branched-chain amino acid aminotransferase